MFDTIYCPNIDCTYKRKLKKGEKCPQCGREGELFSLGKGVELIFQKEGKNPNGTKKEENPQNLSGDKVLFNDTTSEAEIKSQIYKDMENLARQEKGTGILSTLALFTGNDAEALMVKALKAMIDQNKILIRQNELIIRRLEAKN
jgi:hypothetical protein